MLKQIPGTLGAICLALLTTSLVSPPAATADDEVVISDGPVTITHDELAEILASTPDKIRNAAARDRGDRFALINELVINRKLVAEAAVPVALALCDLYLLQLYDAYSGSKPGGGGGGGGGGAPLAGAAKRAAAARASLGDAMPEWDTLLILVLSAVLVLVLLARQMLGE